VAADGAGPAVVGLAAAVTHDTPVAALLASSIAMHSSGPKVWVPFFGSSVGLRCIRVHAVSVGSSKTE
jgi:hypothetical protein